MRNTRGFTRCDVLYFKTKPAFHVTIKNKLKISANKEEKIKIKCERESKREAGGDEQLNLFLFGLVRYLLM